MRSQGAEGWWSRSQGTEVGVVGAKALKVGGGGAKTLKGRSVTGLAEWTARRWHVAAREVSAGGDAEELRAEQEGGGPKFRPRKMGDDAVRCSR
ncbi:Hypothetical predicted protein [Cloeon dipterum]|uniref:Uncharacterized protein n=1 Tax=Cloeon dipterum TaxID=197152 RepID=A0A8S1E896_9INSE|nr:Hypothetical predicted protein [Cloeon dipterum]CAB3388961.1 Hypothetical predicted protein [Cloeon dipterum]